MIDVYIYFFYFESGVVTLWSPNVKEPLVKMLCHRGPVKAIAIDHGGW
jgi:U3 small nucleolar RNA-associated protein 7